MDGYEYGGDCQDSAWEVLYLLEALSGTSSTFQASAGGSPAPSLTLAAITLGESDLQQDVDALNHQLTECVGETTAGEVLQEPAPDVEGWSGLHGVAEDRDLYWIAYASGIVVAQLEPGMDSLGDSLRHDTLAVLALQVERL